MIPSEDQAERVGRALTGGKRDRDFTVFSYVHNTSKLTLFAVKIGDQIVTKAPSAAVPAHQQEN